MAGGHTLPNADEVRAKGLRSLATFETILHNQGTIFAAGGSFTIADIALMITAVSLEAVDFDFTSYPCIANWYEACKNSHPGVWKAFKVSRDGMKRYFSAPVQKQNLSELKQMREQSFSSIIKI